MRSLEDGYPDEFIQKHQGDDWETVVPLIRNSSHYSSKARNSPISQNNTLTPFRTLPPNSLIFYYCYLYNIFL